MRASRRSESAWWMRPVRVVRRYAGVVLAVVVAVIVLNYVPTGHHSTVDKPTTTLVR